METLFSYKNVRFTKGTLHEAVDDILDYANRIYKDMDSREKATYIDIEDFLDIIEEEFGTDDFSHTEIKHSYEGEQCYVSLPKMDFEVVLPMVSHNRDVGFLNIRFFKQGNFNPDKPDNRNLNISYFSKAKIRKLVRKIHNYVPEGIEKGSQLNFQNFREEKKEKMRRSTITSMIGQICAENGMETRYKFDDDNMTTYINMGDLTMIYKVSLDNFQADVKLLNENLPALAESLRNLGTNASFVNNQPDNSAKCMFCQQKPFGY